MFLHLISETLVPIYHHKIKNFTYYKINLKSVPKCVINSQSLISESYKTAPIG